MYAFTPAPVASYVYEFESGRFRWSMRSRPHVAGVCVAEMVADAVGLDEPDVRQLAAIEAGLRGGHRRRVALQRVLIDVRRHDARLQLLPAQGYLTESLRTTMYVCDTAAAGTEAPIPAISAAHSTARVNTSGLGDLIRVPPSGFAAKFVVSIRS